MRSVIIALALLGYVATANAQSAPLGTLEQEWIITKTIRWSLLDRVAQVLCEAERDDCFRNSQCGNPLPGDSYVTCTLRTPQTLIWEDLYRDKARKALEAIK